MFCFAIGLQSIARFTNTNTSYFNEAEAILYDYSNSYSRRFAIISIRFQFNPFDYY